MDKSCHVLHDSFTRVTWLLPHGWHVSSHMYNATRTGRRRLIGSLKLQVIFRKRATKYRALLRKMTYEYKASYDSTPSHTCDTTQYTESCNELMSYVSRTHVMYVSRTHVIDTPQCIACMSHVTRVTVPHSQVWHASPHTCDMTPHTHVTWLNTQGHRRTLHFTWLSHVTCDMTHSHVWHDSSHTCDTTQYTESCNELMSYVPRTHVMYVWHDSSTDTTHYTGLSPYQRYTATIEFFDATSGELVAGTTRTTLLLPYYDPLVDAPPLHPKICAHTLTRNYTHAYTYAHAQMHIQPIGFGLSFLQSQISIDDLVL